MLHNMPQQYRDDPWLNALADAINAELAKQDARAVALAEQMSLDAVSWALPIEEMLAGITPLPDATIEDRRSALKARWRAGGKTTIGQIQAVADAWRNGAVAVTYEAGRIKIQFVGAYGVPTDEAGLKAAVGKVTPAHLPIDYLYRYLLINEIEGVMTLTQIETLTLNKFAGGDA